VAYVVPNIRKECMIFYFLEFNLLEIFCADFASSFDIPRTHFAIMDLIGIDIYGALVLR
jgi:hypothetical protein